MSKYIFKKDFTVNKLIKTLEYNYEFENVDQLNNWPVAIVPRSGSFIADSKTKTIGTTVIFCTNTGICNHLNPDVLPYKLDYSCGLKNKEVLFTNIRLKVNEKGTQDYVYSSGEYITCDNCLQIPIVQISGKTILDKSSNIASITTKIDQLQPGETYTWSYNKISSNWPVTVSPLSGIFIAYDKTYEIETLVSFCQNTSCSGSLGYLDFVSDHLSYTNKYINLGFSINSNNHCYFDNSVYPLNISCKDCITYPSAYFSTQLVNLNSNCLDSSVSMSGLNPYQKYNYFFDSYSANWPITITPISGSFITSSATSANIPFKIAFCGSETLCSGDPNLINYNINYDKLYTDTECEKYAYIRYNFAKSSDFSLQSINNNLIPNNPNIQSDLLKISCNNCIGSGINNVPSISITNSNPNNLPPTGSISGIV